MDESKNKEEEVYKTRNWVDFFLLQGNGGAQILKSLLELLGISLGETLLDNLWCTLDELLGLDQVNTGDDVLDLADQLGLGSSIKLLELDAELGLLSNLLLLLRTRHKKGGVNKSRSSMKESRSVWVSCFLGIFLTHLNGGSSSSLASGGSTSDGHGNLLDVKASLQE